MALPNGVIEVTKQGLDGTPVKVRMFDNAKLQGSIDAAMKLVPADKYFAAGAFVDQTDAKILLAYNRGHWTIAAAAGFDFATKKPEAEFGVRFTLP